MNEKKSIHISSLDLTECFRRTPPPLDFVLPGLLAGSVGALVSPGGTGKSMFALQVGIGVAGGLDTLGLGCVSTGRVVYVSAEDPDLVLHHRLFSLGKVVTAEQLDTIAGNMNIYLVTGMQINIMEAGWRQWITDIAAGTRLIIFDTLRRLHECDENNSGEMAVLIGMLENICRQTDTTILFLHHASKAAAMNGNGAEAGASRGSSVLTDNARCQYNFVGMSPTEADEHGVPKDFRRDYVRLVVAKVNYCAPLPDKWYRRTAGGVLKPVDIGEMRKQVQKEREEEAGEVKPETELVLEKRRGRPRKAGLKEAAYAEM